MLLRHYFRSNQVTPFVLLKIRYRHQQRIRKAKLPFSCKLCSSESEIMLRCLRAIKKTEFIKYPIACCPTVNWMKRLQKEKTDANSESDCMTKGNGGGYSQTSELLTNHILRQKKLGKINLI